MRLFLILSITLLILTTITHASIQILTNPILPIFVGNTNIIINKHTFVSYLNITDFIDLKNNLKQQIIFVRNNKNDSTMASELTEQAWLLNTQIEHLLQAIQPNLRKKRGLINLGGSISKWLFGTLDHEDGEKINSVLNHLNKNDHSIQEKINNQMSIAKEFMSRTNESLYRIRSNVITTMKLLEKYQERINVINALHLIINSLISLENNLNQIINAITFAHLNKVHPTFLSLNNLESILSKMRSLYHKDELAHFKNKQNFYKFLGIQLIFDKKRIIFLIHFPVLYTKQFKSYFIYPVPIQTNIISPIKPYLVLNEKTKEFQYEDDLCEKIEDTFYCKNHLENNDDCVVNIIEKNDATNCTTLPVHFDTLMVNQVTPQNVLLTTPTLTNMIEKCQDERHYTVHPGSYLISIPNKCLITIGTETFYSAEENISEATVILLPSINMSLLEKDESSLNLQTMNLEEIKHITSIVNSQKKLLLQNNEKINHQSWLWITILICVIICILIYFGVRCYYRINYPFPIVQMVQRRNKTENRSPAQPDQP